MKKKLLAIFAVTSLMALASCGGANANGGEDGEGGGNDTVTIKYTNQWGKDKQGVIDGLIEDFEKDHPNIKVEEIKVGGYDGALSQTKSDLSTGNGEHGDLVICYPDHVMTYIDFGVAVNLQTLIDDPEVGWSEDDKADYIAGFVSEGKQFPIEGTYCLPYVKSTEALFYNKDVLIGLNLQSVDPTINNGNAITAEYIDSLTWEEFFGKLCPALMTYNDGLATDKKILVDGGETAINGICGYDSTANLFINLCEQYGYGYTSSNTATGKGSIDFNNDNMKSVMKVFNKASLAGYIKPSTAQSGSGGYCSGYFTKQNLLFNIGSTAGAKHEVSKSFDVNVAPIPGAASGNKHVISQGPSLCILRHNEGGKEMANKRIKAAWELYKFLTSTVNNANWAISESYLPVRISSLGVDDYVSHTDLNKPAKSEELLAAKTCKYSTAASNNVFTSAVFKGSSEARAQVGGLMSEVLLADHELSDAELTKLFDQAYENIVKVM